VHEREGRGAQAGVVGLCWGLHEVVGVDAGGQVDDGEGVVEEGEAVG
jgi:hypothetical protein